MSPVIARIFAAVRNPMPWICGSVVPQAATAARSCFSSSLIEASWRLRSRTTSVAGDLLALPVGCRDRADLGQQRRGIGGVESNLCATWVEVAE